MQIDTITPEFLISCLPSLNDRKVLIVGDLMLDRYIFGAVDRISPEAPVPVVQVEQERHHLGGAGNVARNIRSLGGTPFLVSVCGTDDASRLLKQTLEREQVQASLIEDETRHTTVKTRVIAHNQQVVRIDTESTRPLESAHVGSILKTVATQCDESTVIIVSDYNKGIITSELVQGLKDIVATHQGALRLLADPKPVNIHLYSDFFCITPNAKEAAQAAGMPGLTDDAAVLRAGQALKSRLRSDNLLITLGPRGMVLFHDEQEVLHVDAMAQNVFDVTGAGDTVIATMGLAIAAGHSLLVSSLLANYAAGIVVGEIGAATVTQDMLSDALSRWNMPHTTSWTSGTIGGS